MATDGGSAGHLSPDGSPQGSPQGSLAGQALDGAEIARRMMQAAETAAPSCVCDSKCSGDVEASS